MPLKPMSFGVGNNITVTESNSVALGSNSAISAGTHAGNTEAKNLTAQQVQPPQQVPQVRLKALLDKRRLVRSPWVPQVLNAVSKMWQQVRSVPPAPMRSMVASCTKPPKALPTQPMSLTIVSTKTKIKPMQGFHQRWRYVHATSLHSWQIHGYRGIATHNGQGAVAVGLSKLSDNGQWVFKINGSADTQGHVGAAVGAGFHF